MSPSPSAVASASFTATVSASQTTTASASPTATASTTASSSFVPRACVAADARAVPASLGLQLWPAAHPANAQGVDLVVAPLAACQQMTSSAACAAAASVAGADGAARYVVGTAAALNVEADETLTCRAAAAGGGGGQSPPASMLACAAADARAVPASLGLQLWPAAHPQNAQRVDLVVAPLALCQQMTSAAACAAAASVVGADGVARLVVGTAAALNMEADEALACAGATLSSPALACAPTSARAVPDALGLQLWPAAHPQNAQRVDLVVAPLAACQQMTSAAACAAAASVAGADGVARYVVGTAAALNMEAAAALACAS